MHYRVSGLDPAPFFHLYHRSEEELARQQVRRYVVDEAPGYPDRVELRDAAPGETVLLLNYEHQPAASPYRAAHAIYVREGATKAATVTDRLPEVLVRRVLSLRAFDADGMIVGAELSEGRAADPVIRELLARPRVAYVHAHFAKFGCYAALIERLHEGLDEHLDGGLDERL